MPIDPRLSQREIDWYRQVLRCVAHRDTSIVDAWSDEDVVARVRPQHIVGPLSRDAIALRLAVGRTVRAIRDECVRRYRRSGA